MAYPPFIILVMLLCRFDSIPLTCYCYWNCARDSFCFLSFIPTFLFFLCIQLQWLLLQIASPGRYPWFFVFIILGNFNFQGHCVLPFHYTHLQLLIKVFLFSMSLYVNGTFQKPSLVFGFWITHHYSNFNGVSHRLIVSYK